MKRADIIDLIRFHSEDNEVAFNETASRIAKEFEDTGYGDLAGYIMSLLAQTRTFIPQTLEQPYEYLQQVVINNDPLPLPECISQEIHGLINALNRNMGINTVLFYGAPGTGKTETVKQIARILGKKLFSVDFNLIIDSKLGETSKNINRVFSEIKDIGSESLFLFDEIDALALDRIGQNDVREMGRATSSLLKELDGLDGCANIIATTNLHDKLDKALLRRFDAQINFDKYSHEDLAEIALLIIKSQSKRYDFIKYDSRTLKRIFDTCISIPNPGELKNIIKTSIAFSDPTVETDYLTRLYLQLNDMDKVDIEVLRKQGFTLREIEALTGISRSTIARNLKG